MIVQSLPTSIRDLPPEKIAELVHVYKARHRFEYFCEHVMRTKIGEFWQMPSFHKEWTKLPLKYLMLQIEAFRESAKTSLFSVAYPLWRIGNDPNIRIKVVTSDDDLGVDILDEIKENIKSNEEYQKVFHHVVKGHKWSGHKIVVGREATMKDPTIEAAGVLSTGAGGRCDLLLFDDVCDFRNSIANPSLRPVVASAVEKVWLNLLVPGGQAIWLNTPWHELDYSATIRSSSGWHSVSYPVRDIRGKSIWPEVFSDKELSRRESRAPSSFRQQMLLVPASDAGGPFHPTIIQNCRWEDVQTGLSEPDHEYVTAWDLGKHTNTIGRNVTVGITLDVTNPDKRFIRWFEAYELASYKFVMDRVKALTEIYPGTHVIESNAMGEAMVDIISNSQLEDNKLPPAVIPHATTSKSKPLMIQKLVDDTESGVLGWPATDDLAILEAQLRVYTWRDQKIAQDYVVALSIANYYSDAGGSGAIY